MSRTVTATYRLQLTRDLPFAAVRKLVPYFERLGVSHLYLSPVLAARPGSMHGYDVIDHARVNPELGTEDDLRALAADLHARQMGIILDIVPNHMAASSDNRSWDDVLERGRASRFAGWFDIDWDAPRAHGKVVLPILGDELETVLARGEIKLHIRDSGSRIAYFDKTFPIDARSLPKELQLAQLDPAGRPAADEWASGAQGRRNLEQLLDAQNYRLRFWRHTPEINYRRFFDVGDLVALRMDNDDIFDATHELVLQWVRDGVLDGLRVDHVDGLRVPSWYLARLRHSVDAAKHRDAPARFPILVEKILSGDEELPRDWPVEGTTGYDFMNEVEDLFLDAGGLRAVEANYRGLRHNPSLQFRAVARDGKRRVLRAALLSDVMRLARLAHAWRPDVKVDAFADVIVELIVHLDVYRTYVVEPGTLTDDDRLRLEAAFRKVVVPTPSVAKGRDLQAAVDAVREAFFGKPTPGDTVRAEFVARFQQTSGPATAKGVEDTALYSYVPLAARNEVGGTPDREVVDASAHERLHARNVMRARDWPNAMLATNTHDTKRSADLRARLDVLTALPDVWARHVSRWRRLNRPHKRVVRGKPAPDTSLEYLYYQTLLGLWPAPRPHRRVDDLPDRAWRERARERLVAYMLKAAREAKVRTSWTESDPQYEQALDAFVHGSLAPNEDAPFLGDVARLTAQTAHDGFRFALARILVHCTSPGCPDIYQGDEVWNFTLVDPDNRRPVDFDHRSRLLTRSGESNALATSLSDEDALIEDRTKLTLLARVLTFRREHAELMARGDYLPLRAASDDAGIFAFARQLGADACIAAARTRVAVAGNADGPSAPPFDLPNELAGQWRSALTGRVVDIPRSAHGVTADAAQVIPAAQPCELLLRVSS